MKFIEKLERKYGRIAIPHIIRYIVFAKAITYLACLITNSFGLDLASFLWFDSSAIMNGHQFWRLFSFILLPSETTIYGLLYIAIFLYFTFFLGEILEREWGAFRLNIYLLIGYLCAVGAGLLFKLPAGYVTDSIIHESMFLAFATLFPERQVLIFYFIPVKVKWVGIVTAVLLVINIAGNLAAGEWQFALFILLCLLNYILFFAPRLFSLIKDGSRKQQYQDKIRTAGPYVSPSRGNVVGDKPFHRCAVCGITDLDDPNMTFRYCSECNGSYEYCANHLRNHEHRV